MSEEIPEDYYIKYPKTVTSFYDDIQLTEEEIKEALAEARRKKWFHLEHAQHWIQAEQDAVTLEASEKERIKAARKGKFTIPRRV